jgi:hypothetical protein
MRRCLRAIVIIVVGFGLYAKSSPSSPKEIVDQFVKMDLHGNRLTAQGWRAADLLFVRRSEPVEPKVVVVIGRQYALSTQTEKANTKEFYFGYEEVGRISTSSLRFVPTRSGIESRSFDKYDVVASPVEPIRGDTQNTVERSSSEWKIDGAQPETMHLTAAAAIRYVTQLRRRAKNAAIRGNADQTLVKLAPYR